MRCKKYENNYINILFIITIGVLINSSDLLIYGVLGYKTKKIGLSLLKFNIVYIFDITSIIIYLYRGIKCYNDHYFNINSVNYTKNIFIKKMMWLFLIVLFLYIIIINIVYKDIYIDVDDWQYYPY